MEAGNNKASDYGGEKAMKKTIDSMMCIEIKRFRSSSRVECFQWFEAGGRTIKKAPGRKRASSNFRKKWQRKKFGPSMCQNHFYWTTRDAFYDTWWGMIEPGLDIQTKNRIMARRKSRRTSQDDISVSIHPRSRNFMRPGIDFAFVNKNLFKWKNVIGMPKSSWVPF